MSPVTLHINNFLVKPKTNKQQKKPVKRQALFVTAVRGKNNAPLD